MRPKKQMKAEFIRTLANYLVGDQAAMSIKLQLQKPEALAWAKLRNDTPLMGYPNIDEAEKVLAEFLS